MSIKDLFIKKSINVSNSTKKQDDYRDVESNKYIEEYEKTKARFRPNVDFAEPSEFARYGLSEKYYRDAINYIHKTFPYDGSFYEKQKWKNDSSDIVNYFFENLYPKNTGYIILGNEYGTSTTTIDGYGNTNKEEYIVFNGTYNEGNKYEPQNNRGYNLKLDGESGATVEFYLKKEDLNGSEKQVIFDLWNSSSEGTDKYGRFKIEIHPGISGEEDKFYVDVSSGSNGFVNIPIGTNLDFTSSWNHYGIAFQNSGSEIKLQLFVNGDLYFSTVTGSSISAVKGPLKAHIGSLITSASGSASQKGWGKLSGSLDEFRYWKKRRTDKEISRNYFLQVAGGVNTDDANTDLGVYFKFNEGIYDSGSISSYDKIVLDYSGRASNGSWIGYSLGSRNTGSGIILSSNSKKEERDPIVYAQHPDVLSLTEQYASIGYEYDIRNNSNIYNTLPLWIVEEDQRSGYGTRDLFQIMSEFFDQMHNEIKYLPSIRHDDYRQNNPLPFTIKILENRGFDVADIFGQASLLEDFMSRNETEDFEDEIYKLKNYIYQNIYNNLLFLYRSKGTEKSFRNLIHCFGIDEDLLSVSLYAENQDFKLEDRIKNKAVEKRLINFNSPDNFGATIYQEEESGNGNSLGYIPGSYDIKDFGSTIEGCFFFPKKFSKDESFYYPIDFYSSSLFGLHETATGEWASPDRASIQVFAVRPELESKDVRFQLSSSHFEIDLSSDLVKDVYDDNKWNIALRIKPKKYPQSSYISGSSIGDYSLELYGVSYEQDIKENNFLLTASISLSKADDFYSANKKMYVGAHRENYSGSLVSSDGTITGYHKTDVELISAKYWHSYLDDYTVEMHAKDITSYGADSAEYDTAVQQHKLQDTGSYGRMYAQQNETLALHWNHFNVFPSNGEFTLGDFSSGSLDKVRESFITNVAKYQLTGKGYQFSNNSDDFLKKRTINTTVIREPEKIDGSDLINILTDYEEFFEGEDKPINHYFMIEKSISSIISKEMISWLGSITKMNELIGKPKSRYEQKYTELEKIRQKFFENVENEPDFDRFMDFYKWIDDSISLMIEQMIPASMNYSPGVFNVVESHVFERNKYRHKLPTIEFNGDPPQSTLRGIQELLYGWQYGHAPISGLENQHCYWWKNRAERTGFLNETREPIFEILKQTVNRNFGTTYKLNLDGRDITKYNLAGSILNKKREKDIIINEIARDLTGVNRVSFSDLLPANGDCDD